MKSLSALNNGLCIQYRHTIYTLFRKNNIRLWFRKQLVIATRNSSVVLTYQSTFIYSVERGSKYVDLFWELIRWQVQIILFDINLWAKETEMQRRVCISARRRKNFMRMSNVIYDHVCLWGCFIMDQRHSILSYWNISISCMWSYY